MRRITLETIGKVYTFTCEAEDYDGWSPAIISVHAIGFTEAMLKLVERSDIRNIQLKGELN